MTMNCTIVYISVSKDPVIEEQIKNQVGINAMHQTPIPVPSFDEAKAMFANKVVSLRYLNSFEKNPTLEQIAHTLTHLSCWKRCPIGHVLIVIENQMLAPRINIEFIRMLTSLNAKAICFCTQDKTSSAIQWSNLYACTYTVCQTLTSFCLPIEMDVNSYFSMLGRTSLIGAEYTNSANCISKYPLKQLHVNELYSSNFDAMIGGCSGILFLLLALWGLHYLHCKNKCKELTNPE